jgi:hypothetical protein
MDRKKSRWIQAPFGNRSGKYLGKRVFNPLTVACVLCLTFSLPAFAAGLFGPPQTPSKTTGGLNTAVAYSYAEDVFKTTSDFVLKRHHIYSQAAYGKNGLWEVYGRLGVSDLKIAAAFRSMNALTTTSRTDFEENWKFFGTLGAKAFYPATRFVGVGAFIQGTYHFSNYTDSVPGAYLGAPFEADLKIKNLWDIQGGLNLQVTLPYDIKIYTGPFAYYSDADAVLSVDRPGLSFTPQKTALQNKSKTGAFGGVDIPLAKGFRLTLEGQVSERLSIGAAETYIY